MVRFLGTANSILGAAARWRRDRRIGTLRRAADRARDNRDHAEAARLYGGVLALDGSLSEIYVQCGHMNKELGRLEEAEACYLAALALTPDDPDLHLQIGHLHKVAGRNGEAAWAYYCASKLRPGWAEALGELCALYEREGPRLIGLLSNRGNQQPRAKDCPSGTTLLVGLSDWATVGGTTALQVCHAAEQKVTVELFPLLDLRSKEALPAPTIAIDAAFEPAAGLHVARSSDWLEDGPYMVIARTAAGEGPLALQAVNIDSMSRWRSSYLAVVEEERALLALDRSDMERFVQEMRLRPRFLVVVEGSNPERMTSTVAALERQIYPTWICCRADGDFTKEVLQSCEADFVVCIEAGDELTADALFEFASAINAWPEIDLHYADEDSRLAGGQPGNPFYKPDWSPDYLEVFNYIGRPACFRMDIAYQAAGGIGYYDFVLRFCEKTNRIRHIRRVLCTVHRSAQQVADRAADRLALAGRLERTQRRGTVAPLVRAGYGWDIRIALARMPLVSIVLPTAGMTVEFEGRRIDLLANALLNIYRESSYGNIEVVIIHNGNLSVEHEALATSFGCRLVHYSEPRFNISKKLNLGVSEARGEFVVLLNDDIEVANAAWIERMLEHFEKDHVGVVGARLLYPDGTIQHAGVVMNWGAPDHVMRGAPGDSDGYFLSTSGTHNYAAVTGACMMVRRDDYISVGGFPEDLAISYNDIDFCQKIRLKGRSIVYAPQVVLTHMESQSREPVLDPEETAIYQKRWAVRNAIDPFYNEVRLSIVPPTFEVTFNGRYI